MPGSTSSATGSRWEKVALDHLESRGLVRITENFRCRMGEIDLIMRDRDCLVFIEVRYRRANRFTSAAASVDDLKQRRLTRAAALFLARHPEFCDLAVRFDVVAFDAAADDQCTLQWLRDAFRVEA